MTAGGDTFSCFKHGLHRFRLTYDTGKSVTFSQSFFPAQIHMQKLLIFQTIFYNFQYFLIIDLIVKRCLKFPACGIRSKKFGDKVFIVDWHMICFKMGLD